ncbi:mechanosensitive ion channel family protein [Thiovibrio sp. JS02]
MKTLLQSDFYRTEFLRLKAWLLKYVLTADNFSQALIIVCAMLTAYLIGKRLEKRFSGGNLPKNRFTHLLPDLLPLAFPFVWLCLQGLALAVAAETKWPHHLLNIVVNLLAAWIMIEIASSLLINAAWAKVIAVIAWTLAALNIMGLLTPTIRLLDRIALGFGTVKVSVLTVLEGIFILALLLWLARLVSGLIEKRMQASPTLSPSVQVLFSKLSKITLVTIAILVALRMVGIDLTAFTIFTGAVGVGIGFGLQKIISNLVSGIILLLDKSIKPGDIITVGSTYGWVNSLGARYTSLVTREGKEFLIPNEDLITQKVENWSFSNSIIRLDIPVGISYRSDVRRAISLCEEAARRTNRVIGEPLPVCLLRGFGDSSVDLELRFWINDPINGIGNVKSAVLLRIWERFHEHGIEIPYPQRDIHIRTPQPPPGFMAQDREKETARP